MVARYGVRMLGQITVINREGEITYNGPPLSYETLSKIVEEAQ